MEVDTERRSAIITEGWMGIILKVFRKGIWAFFIL